MASRKKPYSLKYSDREFKFMMPRYKKFAHMLTDQAVEERTQVCRFFNKKTIQVLFEGLDLKRQEPVLSN